MRRLAYLSVLITLALAVLAGLPARAPAAGFGTPTLDGTVDAVYGAAEATDPSDPPQGNAVMDLGSLYVCNDNTFWYFLFTINADINATNWGKYLLLIDTTNDANGGTVDPWARRIAVSDPHKNEYSIRSWVDALPYGTEDTQFWVWNGTTWSQSGAADGAARAFGATSALEWKVARSRLGDPSQIWVEVVSTGGTATDNGQDTSNDPPNDWNATNWTDTSLVVCSTNVPRQSGVDATPPTLLSACSSTPATQLLLTFSEPLDATSAETEANYAATGKTVLMATLIGDSSQVLLLINSQYGFGSCQQVTVTGVKDRANNTIVNNGTTNVARFYRSRLFVRGHMGIHMTNHAIAGPDTFAIEGSLAPLTWDPLCDKLLADADNDSVFTANVDFCLPCTTASGGFEETQLEYKFTHMCTEYEGGSNHVYTVSGATVIDTVDIWWDNQAPVDFTNKAIDVLFFVRSPNGDPPFGAGDTLGLNGSQNPLNWNVPPTTLMRDDGVLPDTTAGDGVFSARITFPTNTLKNVEFKYLKNGAAAPNKSPDLAQLLAFAYECTTAGNRNVFLNDSIFSTTVPIVLPKHYYNDCLGQTGVDDAQSGLPVRYFLSTNRPNPATPGTEFAFELPQASLVKLTVYDASGRVVRRLLEKALPAGRHRVGWDGRDEAAEPLGAGVYFYRLEAGAFGDTRKMVLVR
jgi:hypothetical protein